MTILQIFAKIKSVSNGVPESEVARSRKKQELAAATQRVPVAQNEQEPMALSLINYGWVAIAQLDEALQSVINRLAKTRA